MTLYKETIEDSPTFEDFWNAYGYKKGRIVAERKWSLLKPREKIKCIESIPKYKDSLPTWQSLQHPKTFLGQRTFEDEDWGEENSQRLDPKNARKIKDPQEYQNYLKKCRDAGWKLIDVKGNTGTTKQWIDERSLKIGRLPKR